MGARTDAARSEVLAARAGLDEELVRLEASGRAAVDIPARLKRNATRDPSPETRLACLGHLQACFAGSPWTFCWRY